MLQRLRWHAAAFLRRRPPACGSSAFGLVLLSPPAHLPAPDPVLRMPATGRCLLRPGVMSDLHFVVMTKSNAGVCSFRTTAIQHETGMTPAAASARYLCPIPLPDDPMPSISIAAACADTSRAQGHPLLPVGTLQRTQPGTRIVHMIATSASVASVAMLLCHAEVAHSMRSLDPCCCPQAATQEHCTSVRTAEEFAGAVTSGVSHVRVCGHLDLRELPAAAQGALQPGPLLESITVRSEGPPRGTPAERHP